jgi:hypothetical protein
MRREDFSYPRRRHGSAWELGLLLLGAALLYVDDAMGCSIDTDLVHDMTTAQRVMRSLLGDTAVADDKTETALALAMIGYLVDLETKRIGLSP